MTIKRVRLAFLLLFVAGCGGQERSTAGIRLAVGDSPEIGRYLSDDSGRALYVLLADPSGASVCDRECAAAWPPAPSSEPPLEPVEPAVQTQLIGSFVRTDGFRQLTYASRALYYRGTREEVPQRSVTDQWGTWSLVFPHGEPMSVPQ